jgi:hypothetical protein
MFKNKASIYVILTVLIIIVAGVYSALYYKPINNLLTDNSDLDLEGEVQGLLDDIMVEPSATEVEKENPTETTVPSLDKVENSKTIVFIDTNLDGKKTTDEAACVYCVARELVCSDGTTSSLDKVANLKMTAIDAKGLVVNEKVRKGDLCWGAFDDRKIFIPNTKIDYSQETGDIEIPARYITTLLAGTNADIFEIREKSTGEYIYIFNSILPALRSMYESNKEIWVRYTPDANKVDSYYLKNTSILLDESGSLTGIKHGYYLQIKWNFSQSFLNIKDELAYDFIL